MMMKKIIVASTSTLFGEKFLEYLLPVLALHFQHVDRLLFIPYARPGGISYEAYTQKVKEALKELPIDITGIHDFMNPKSAVENAEAIFIGGGNTFVLLDTLIRLNLMSTLKSAVENGKPYLGTSAGTNIVGRSIKTTNDMPIVHPPTLDALNLIPMNINPHYLDPDPNSKHKGETRETRIKEFHEYNAEMVVGLREGSWIEVNGNEMILRGNHTVRIFRKDEMPFELEPGAELTLS
jgi:dipeptidase E